MKQRLTWMVAAMVAVASAHAYALDTLCDTRYQDCRAPLLSYIGAEPAGGSIDVAFWFMEDGRYVNALINAKNRGVSVRVIVDPRANGAHPLNTQFVDQLKNAGIPMRMKVQTSWGDILHWKMMYFASQDVLEWSAANYTPYSFVPQTPYSNYIDEVVYFTNDARLTGSFRTKFENFWTDTSSGQFADYANITPPLTRKYPISTLDPALNFPPQQDYASRAVSAYNKEPSGANGGKIDVIMFRISDAEHADAMIAARSRGIPVRLITEPDNYRDDRYIWHSYNVDRMYMAGVQIKSRIHQGLTHQKSVILYGQGEVIYGGSNWSSASADQQYEHNIFSQPCSVITGGTWCDPGWFLQFFADQFEAKWNASSEYAPFVPGFGGTPVNYAPANGASGVGTTVTLDWDGGNWNHKYDVYLGTDPNNQTKIASDLMVGSPYTGRHETWQIPMTLTPGTTYYWHVVGKTMADKAKNGPTWSFTTGGVAADSTPYGGTPAQLPGIVQAENFDEGGPGVAYVDTTSGNSGGAYRQTDVDIAATNDSGGGFNLGYTRGGEWLKYTVNVTTGGTYTLSVRYANKGTGASLHVEVDGVNKTGSLTLQDTGGWQAWQDIVKSGISLTAGQHVVRLVFDTTGSGGAVGNINYLNFTTGAPSQPTPYGGSPAPIPGVVQAENFDSGGEAVAYHDTTAGNSGGAYRQTDVDIAAASDTGGGFNLGYTRAGEWLKYTVSVGAAGTYNLRLRYANVGTGASVHVEVDGANVTGAMPLQDTGGWQNWADLNVVGISLSAGTHVLRLAFDTANAQNTAVGNINYLSFTTSSSSTAFNGTPTSLPGLLEAENFDTGGEGAAYHDTTTGNSGGAYRQTDVDIAATSDTGGGYNLGYTRVGEWLKYTVSVVATGTYNLVLRYANIGTGAAVHVNVDGANVTGPMALDDTGGWQNWRDLVVSGVDLTAGTHVLTLLFDAANADNGAAGNINYLNITQQ